MKKVKKLLIWCIPLVLITVALMTPAVTQAVGYGSVWIYPEDLIPMEPGKDDYRRSPLAVSNGDFYALLHLPKDSSILSVTYYHSGTYQPSTGQEPITGIFLLEQKRVTASWGNELGYAFSSDATGEIIPVEVNLATNRVKIRQNYQYFIWFFSDTNSSHFMGAKVNYMTP